MSNPSTDRAGTRRLFRAAALFAVGAAAVVLVASTPTTSYHGSAYPDGASFSSGYTNSPLDAGRTCAICHSGPPVNASFVTAPIRYVPGESAISITVGSSVAGFQLTALSPGNQGAGSFESQSASLAKLNSSGAEYMAHRSPGSGPWTIDWTPPASNIGTVTIYAAARLSNNNVVLQTRSISANQAPTASFTANPSSGEAPLMVAFNASASSDPDGSITNYAWTFGDGGTGSGATTNHTYASAGTYPVQLTVTDDNGVTDTQSTNVFVAAANQAPTASFTADPPSGDAPLMVAFNAGASFDPDGSIADYSWTFGDGGTGSGVTTNHTFASPGTFLVQLIITDNDGATATQNTSVFVEAANQAPTASFSADPPSGEAPLMVAFNASASSDPDGSITNYAWTFGDGGAGSGVTTNHTYASAGTYPVQLTITDNDGATATQSVNVFVDAANQVPVAAFSASTLTGEAPLLVEFDGGDSSDPDGTVTRFDWLFGDGSTGSGQIASHTFTGVGNYEVRLTVHDNDGSSATTTQTVTVTDPVNQLPVAAVSANPVSGVEPLQVTFDGSGSQDPDGSIAQFNWEFGDGDTDSGPTATHTYSAAGSYQARLTVLDDDGASDFETVEISVSAANQAPVAAFSATPTSGARPLQVTFDAGASSDPDGSIAGYAWQFGNGSTASGTDRVTNTYTLAGVYEVQLTITDDDGATATATETITVSEPANQAPVAAFTATPTSGERPLQVTFDAGASSDIDGSIAGYAWRFGNGSTASGTDRVTNTYTLAGIYEVQLTVTDDDGATATATETIAVSDPPTNQAPVAVFSATPTSGTRPLQVTFDAGASSDPDGSITGYAWQFGNGSTASGTDRVTNTYTLAGTYNVRLVITDNQGATASAMQVITVAEPSNQAPVAVISASPMTGMAPLDVAFDASGSSDPDGSIVGHTWDFGDGSSASGQTAEHTFGLAGTYTVRLTSTDDAGGVGSATMAIQVQEPGAFRVSAVYPNPIRDRGVLVLEVKQQGRYEIRIFNLLGKEVAFREISSSASGQLEIPIELGGQPGGLFTLLVTNVATGQRVSSRVIHLW